MSSHRDLHGSRHAPPLLDLLADQALDADYEEQARRGPRPPRRGARAAAVVALGLLIGVGVVQSARGEPAARQGRAELVEQVEAGQAALAARRTRLAAVRRDLARLSASDAELRLQEAASDAAADRIDRLAAARRQTGPGVRVTVDDAPGADAPEERVLDKDLQRLVNGFWAAGATAIAVEDVRLTALSSIRTAGEAVTVDYRSVRAPYDVVVLGDPNGLQAGFVDTTHGRYWYQLVDTVGVTLDVRPASRLVVPAARRSVLRVARAEGDESP